MKVNLIGYPSDHSWMEVKRRALVTMGLNVANPPDEEWKRRILEARHSPIRYLTFSFYLEVPSYVATHFARHIHAQPYIKSQRNDRQDDYDRNKAPQDTEVSMIWDINAEELMIIMNKRLCSQADPTTREIVRRMRDEVIKVCPEIKEFLVPMCEYHGGVCHEMFPCKK